MWKQKLLEQHLELKILGCHSLEQGLFISTAHEHAYLGGATVYDHAPGLCFYYYGFDA